DLPANKLSVDIKNGFKPVFEVIPGKEKSISNLKKLSKGKEMIFLATDPDREGEAISWHIKERLTKKDKKFSRVVFHEITEDALKEAFSQPGEIDINRVNSQIARRVLDRIVGYTLSPVLWKKIVRGLSAGRVQSIALKFIVERERSIEAFQSVTTYTLDAKFKIGENVLKAKLNKYKGKKIFFDDKNKALEFIEKLKSQNFTIKDIVSKQTKRKPPSPHITSLLQQDAFNKLRFSAQKTMIVAQRLYEGTQIGDKSVGLITYMRTDSFEISPKAKKEAKEFVRDSYGEDFLASKEYRYKKKKGAQLAHEAIRPTSIYRKPEDIQDFISEDELKLYTLIWKRFIAGFMKESVYENQKAFIVSEDAEFIAEGRKLVFEGYLKAFFEEQEEESLPDLEKGQNVILEGLDAVEHITKPPARYNDASLVKLLEEKGIGRPSTYAAIINTLIYRIYIKREKRIFFPTDLGEKVNDLLVKFFLKVMDENFTAEMEEKLDEVEAGTVEWNKILEDFYPSFKAKADETLEIVQKDVEFSDKMCQKCDGRLVMKWSRKGKFLSCEHFPKCKYAESITTAVSCPDCKVGLLIQRRNRRGQDFYGCSKFPECTYTSRELPSTEEEDNKKNLNDD
ncbi:MAG: type I DNA topoisomerase, partial [Candidatus Omnitrophica bacterium]|nr:type I DNA topoisomerase [Candidatus Omnitrophota bacterium]